MVDVVFLSRLQFALTIMFHYLFPPLTIGMGVVLVYLEGMFLWKREPIYETAARFWTSELRQASSWSFSLARTGQCIRALSATCLDRLWQLKVFLHSFWNRVFSLFSYLDGTESRRAFIS